MRKLSPYQRRLLAALADYDGVFDRYYRIVVAGQIVSGFQATTALWAFRYGYIEIYEDRVILTRAGADRLKEDG